jgi:hypothetical protein
MSKLKNFLDKYLVDKFRIEKNTHDKLEKGQL